MNPDIRLWGQALADYITDEGGASAGEYALILGVLAGCIIMILHSLGRHMDRTFETVANLIEPYQ
jgi:Flp pilus assembly pilin Flp